MNLRYLFKTIFFLFVVFGSAQAQEGQPKYVQQMADYSINFYEVQKSFNDYWSDREVERSQGWKQFKRWEAFMEPRVYPGGERPDPTALWAAQQAGSQNGMKSGSTANWTHIGPFDGNAISGIGRVNAIAFHPDNSNIIFAGTPAGGLWKSNDGGVNWSTQTDLLPNLGVSDIAIDPHHPDTMYIATGDRDGGDTYSIGLLKSVDGGITWQTTGLSFNVSNFQRVTGLYINPKNTDQIVASTRSGIQRSTDGGVNWVNVQNGSFQMLTYSPSASDTLFAGTYSSGQIWRSTDAGASWTRMLSGLPTSGVTRVEVATTADDPNYVYAIIGAPNNGLYGIYRSTDGGSTWTLRHDGALENLLHWDTSPSGNFAGGSPGGQAWYDLAIAVSPLDRDLVYVGGVNIWRSSNGGSLWSLSAHWYGGGGADYAHADQHNFTFKPGTSELYVGNDGGVYSTYNGINYTSLCNGLHITQYYKIGVTEADPDMIIGGAQDNGTHLFNSFSMWDRVRGGDGMDCEIDPINPDIMYASLYYGDFTKSVNGGSSFSAPFNLPPAGSGNWVTPFALDPSNSNILYAGFNQLWKSTNAGVSFSATSSAVGSGNISAIAISKSDGQVIYIAKNEVLYRSDNGGASWMNISGGIGNTNSITDIAISPFYPYHVFITKSGYSSGQKVFVSTDGGANWTNLSGTLPNLPVNTIVYQESSQGDMYIGTDLGVYYRNATLTDWVPYMNGLPNTIINDLEIIYSTGTLRAGTYGRGAWDSPLMNSNSGKPVADFSISPENVCSIGDTVELIDESLFGSANWQWTITPGTFTFTGGTSATSSHPKVLFQAAGNYLVQLIASNASGSDTIVRQNAISIGGNTLPFTENFSGGSPAGWDIINPDADITWQWDSVHSGSMYMDFYIYSAIPNSDELITPLLSFTGMDDVYLKYDMSYRPYSTTTKDSLHIYISTDCGSNWTLIDARGENGTLNFATGGSYSTSFVPTASDWRSDTLDLSTYDGIDQVMIKFVGVNDYGNNLYLDNIEVNGQAATAPTADFYVNQTVCGGSSVQFLDLSNPTADIYEWIFPGGTPSTSALSNPVVTYATSGTYDVTMIVSNTFGSDTLVRTAHINVQASITPSVQLTTNDTTTCDGDVVIVKALTTGAGSAPMYEWYLNGNFYGMFGDSIVINSLNHGDSLVVKVISSESCVTSAEVFSQALVFTVYNNPFVALDIPQRTVCVTDGPYTLVCNPPGGTLSGPGVSGLSFDPQTVGIGNYILSYAYTSTYGCTTIDTALIEVTGPPNVFLSGTTYCENDPVQTLGGGFPFGGDYAFNGSPATTVDPSLLTPGAYPFTYTYSNGICSRTVTDTIYILQVPVNPVISIVGNALVCNLSGYNYQWLDGSGNHIPGAIGQSFSPVNTGFYSVTVSIGTCTATSSQIHFVGLNERIIREMNLSVFPNPAREYSVVQFELNQSRDVTIEVLDVAGRRIETISLGDVSGKIEQNINTKEFAPGVYLVNVKLGEFSTSMRLVKE